jgi:DNA (cytosine-5)-methyltransferase 1
MNQAEGTELGALRRNAGLSISQISEECGHSESDIESWEKGLSAAPVSYSQALGVLSQFPSSSQTSELPSNEIDDHKSQRPYIKGVNSLAAPNVKVRVLSFFSGAGGLDLGFEQAGFEIVRASDIDSPSCKTLNLNKGGFLNDHLAVACEDIRNTDLFALPTKIDLIIGGPPCQSFSASGRRAGGAAGRLDMRGNLFQSYCKIIDHVRPKAFVFENVRGILSTNGGEDWTDIVNAFKEIGYKLTYRILDALDFGAPQQRERMFLVGTRDDFEFLFPRPTHGPDSVNKLPHISSGEALHGINEDENLNGLKMLDGKYAHLLHEVPPGQNYLFFTARRGYPKPIFAYRSRFSDFLYKADPAQPVKTLIAKPGKYTGPLHWDNRYFSVKEYKRLQGFPDGYQFYGSRDDIIRQIGNSVSPKIAYALALSVMKQIFGMGPEIALISSDQQLSFDKRKGLKAQQTRQVHATVASRVSPSSTNHFAPCDYVGSVVANGDTRAVDAKLNQNSTVLTIGSADKHQAYAEFQFAILKDGDGKRNCKKTLDANSVAHTIHVRGFGSGDAMPQLIWNAVDDWVQRASHYHSLFELYGHFTEPYPQFYVSQFRRYDGSPIARFMEFAAAGDNCSRYLPKALLEEMFENDAGWDDFHDVATWLRAVRFDVRSKETNIAINRDEFIIAYPFTLPHRRQMNFTVKRRGEEVADLAA